MIARHLTASDDGFLNGARHLIHARDPLFIRGMAGWFFAHYGVQMACTIPAKEREA
jgi:hypothetical protein